MVADCIFCKIVAGEIPSEKVYEDAETIAFLDIRPVNPGHTLVIPKAHYRNMLDVPSGLWSQVTETARKVGIALKEAVGADGINISSSHEPAAGQEVFHLHLHIIPRLSGDGLKHWPQQSYGEGDMKKTGDAIRRSIAKA
jgi:histidine triad (HIT) family protein